LKGPSIVFLREEQGIKPLPSYQWGEPVDMQIAPLTKVFRAGRSTTTRYEKERFDKKKGGGNAPFITGQRKSGVTDQHERS